MLGNGQAYRPSNVVVTVVIACCYNERVQRERVVENILQIVFKVLYNNEIRRVSGVKMRAAEVTPLPDSLALDALVKTWILPAVDAPLHIIRQTQ